MPSMLIVRVYTLLKKKINLSTIDKIHSKGDVINASVVKGLTQPLLFSFVFNKPSGYKNFSQPETIYYK